MTIDWTREIEAYHEDGRVVPMRFDGKAWDRTAGWVWLTTDSPAGNSNESWRENGEDFCRNSGWRIRNEPEHPTPTQYAPELVESAFAFVRKVAGRYVQGSSDDKDVARDAYEWMREADRLVSDLPQEVDPDDQAASDLVTKLSREGFIFGNTDQAESVAMAGIKLGRQLQRGEAA